MSSARRVLPKWTLPCAALAWVGIVLLARAGVDAPASPFSQSAVLVASLVRVVLGWLGIAVSQLDEWLYVPGGFSYVVTVGCTGLLPAAVVAIAILASPVTPVARAVGFGVSVPLVLLLNVARLVHLFYLGLYAPQSFALAHEVLWECALVASTAGIWFAWWKWASRSLNAATAPAHSADR